MYYTVDKKYFSRWIESLKETEEKKVRYKERKEDIEKRYNEDDFVPSRRGLMPQYLPFMIPGIICASIFLFSLPLFAIWLIRIHVFYEHAQNSYTLFEKIASNFSDIAIPVFSAIFALILFIVGIPIARKRHIASEKAIYNKKKELSRLKEESDLCRDYMEIWDQEKQKQILFYKLGLPENATNQDFIDLYNRMLEEEADNREKENNEKTEKSNIIAFRH